MHPGRPRSRSLSVRFVILSACWGSGANQGRCVLGDEFTSEFGKITRRAFQYRDEQEPRYFREVDQELRPWPVMFTLVPLAIGCAILVWVPILIPLWHWLRGY